MNSDWNRQVLQIVIGNDPLYGPQSVAYNVWVASGDATMLYRVVGIDASLPDDDDDDDDADDDDDDDDFNISWMCHLIMCETTTFTMNLSFSYS